MREIKFRAWIDGEYLVYSDMSKTHPYTDDEIIWDIQGGLEVSTYETSHRVVGGDVDEFESFMARGGEGDEVIFMQYTGIVREEREVYEGDIYYVAGTGNCVISIDPYLGVMFTDSEGEKSSWIDEIAENNIENYLGTIHENPELLESEK